MLRFQKNNCIPGSLPERSGFRATPLDCCGRGSTVQGTARPSAYNILCIIRSQPQMLQSIHPPARDSGFSAGQCGDRDSTEENNSPWPLFPSSIANRLVETENPKPKTSTCEQCRCARTLGPLFMFCSELAAWLLGMDDCLSNRPHACSFRSGPTSGMMSVLAFARPLVLPAETRETRLCRAPGTTRRKQVLTTLARVI
jgi:hypothetical protein